jgi:hypothetical protein
MYIMATQMSTAYLLFFLRRAEGAIFPYRNLAMRQSAADSGSDPPDGAKKDWETAPVEAILLL